MRDRRVSLLSRGLLISLLPIALAHGATFAITSGPGYGVWSVGDIQAPLIATGGTPPYTWSISEGSLPAGLHIRTDNTSPLPDAQLNSQSIHRRCDGNEKRIFVLSAVSFALK